MQIIYRLSPERSTGKPRPAWFSKRLCLDNCLDVFGSVPSVGFHLVCDQTNGEDWRAHLRAQAEVPCGVTNISCGQAGAGFLEALRLAVALPLPEAAVVYLIEDDYLHRRKAAGAIQDAIRLGFDYVTLYDHPDKYLSNGPNHLVKHGAEDTRLYLGKECHWKLTNSTTMSFACRLGTLREDAETFREFTRGNPVPPDFAIFDMLRRRSQRRRRIGSSVPAYATHCESQWLAPLVDWAQIAAGE